MSTPNPYAPPQAAVQDVGEPGDSLPKAERGTRLAASILDGIIAAAMIVIPMVIVGGWRPGGRANPAGSFLAFAGFVAWAWLTVLFVARNGQSIAKKMLGIKVVRTDGSPASLGRIFLLRNVINTILGIIPLYGLVDALLIFGEPRQCVHDKIADTIVVKA